MTQTPALAASTSGTTTSVEDTRLLTIRAAIRSALDALLERQAKRREELEEFERRLQAERERRLKERARRERESVEETERSSIRHPMMCHSRAFFDRDGLDKVRQALRERREQEIRAFANRVIQGVREVYGGNAAPFYRAAGLSRSAYSKIISHSDHKPSKETVLSMAAALGMNLDDAKAFLHLVGYSLSEYVREDVIWATCFEHGVHGLDDIKSLLAEFGNAAPSGSTGKS